MKVYDKSAQKDLFKEPVGEPMFEVETLGIGEVIRRNGKLYVAGCIGRLPEPGYAIVREITLSDAEPETFAEQFLKCPACGYEDGDSFELSDSEDDHECGQCGATFSYERDVSVTYSATLKKLPDVREVA